MNRCPLLWPMLLLAGVANGQGVAFKDSFEDNKGWSLFEELVGGSACYGAGIGELSFSTERALSGKRAMRLWANKAGSPKSNHLIAVKRLGNTGWTGKWTYSVHVFIPVGTEPYQTGPEISVQNTRLRPSGDFLTYTAAIQYQANRYVNGTGAWAVWREKSPGVAGWEHIFDRDLKRGAWYRLSLEIDYDTNRYGWFTVEGEDEKRSFDLTQSVIAGEKKHSEAAFAITLEGENFWNNCGEAGIFQQRFYYDDVRLAPTEEPKVISVRPSRGGEDRQRFQFRFQAASEDRPLSVVNVLVNRELDPRAGCYLAYSAASDALHLMNEAGDVSLGKMPGTGTGKLNGRYCSVVESSVTVVGSGVLLEVELAFNPETFAGERTIFLAARDAHGGNSGWVSAGTWLVNPGKTDRSR